MSIYVHNICTAVFDLLSVAEQVILQDNNLVTILHIMKGNKCGK